MATSGTTTFSVTRNNIIESSLRLLGVLEEGVQPTAQAIENASMVLNMMLKDWMTDGIKLWTVTELVIPLNANQTTYTIGPSSIYDLNTNKPLRLIQAFLRNISVNPNVDLPMTIISEQEYNILGAKKNTGTINTVFYKPYLNHGELKVFLTPNASTVADYELHMNVQKPIQDITTANQTFDFPQEWYQSLRWGLAAELAADYGLPMDKLAGVIQRSEQYKQRLAAWDVEYASTFFQPDIRAQIPRFR